MTHTALRQYRIERNLSRKELAELVECCEATITFHENGRVRRAHPPLRRRLEAYFGVPMSELSRPETDEGPDNVEAPGSPTAKKMTACPSLS